MQLSNVIEMDPAEARTALRHYRELRTPTQEDREVIAGLLALVAGKQLVNLRDVIRDGGLDERGLPKLAVMWADAAWCYLEMTWGNGARNATPIFRAGRTGNAREFRYLNIFAEHSIQGSTWGVRSQVPPIPPQLRPAQSALKHFAVLWEVEEWKAAPRPPGDPALLRPITADLWSVEATWDLTDLERLVLGGRT
jgi:hypothetical protein